MMDPEHFSALLRDALAGDRAAIGLLLEPFHPYVLLLARRQCDPRLQSRIDPLDVVQQTLLEAHRDLASFNGSQAGEFAAWLRTILHRNVLQSRERHLDAQRRSVKREQAAATPSGQTRLLQDLVSDQSSPSRRAMRGENAVLLAEALENLPNDQAEAVRLRHLEGWSIKAMSVGLERSETAVAGLVKRGLQKLREIIVEDDQLRSESGIAAQSDQPKP